MERGIGTTPAAGAELANVLPVQIMAPQATKAKASKKKYVSQKTHAEDRRDSLNEQCQRGAAKVWSKKVPFKKGTVAGGR
jgi:hypothetical protein